MPASMYNPAGSFATGSGGARDIEAAIEWYIQAEEAGDEDATAALDYLCEQGHAGACLEETE